MIIGTRRSLLSGLKKGWVALNVGGSLWPGDLSSKVYALKNNFSTCTAASSSTAPQETMTGAVTKNWGNLEPMDFDSFSVYRLYMKDDGTFPNNPDYPMILFREAFHSTVEEAEKSMIGAGWTRPWTWGIFPYHHYHSTAWELLLCVQGTANVQLGGEQGPTTIVSKGDLLLIPPGLAHKQLQAFDDFTLLGSYPPDSPSIDVLRTIPTERQRENIRQCKPPSTDPLFKIDLTQFY